MDIGKRQYFTGLSITSIPDQFGRETEIWRGYKDIILVHKGIGNETDTIRRFTLQEFEELTMIFQEVIASRAD